jgi:tRNA G18 (ribose-2'-O)-methylase SpoU
LVQQKNLLRSKACHDDVRVLALQYQLHLVEQKAAQLVAQEIAHRPPTALMAVISPKHVGGFTGADRRRAPGEEGGGAPCPSEFLLHRHKRPTQDGPTRQHPCPQQHQEQQHQSLKGDKASPSKVPPLDTSNDLLSQPVADLVPQDSMITVLLENPSKGTNWGPLLRCCVAFGISRIYAVGFDKCSVQGSHGASKHIELVSFPTHQAAVNHLVHQEGFSLMGLLKGHVQTFEDDDGNASDMPVPVEIADAPTTSVPNERASSTKFVRVVRRQKQHNDGDGDVSSELNPHAELILSNRQSFPAHTRKFVKRTCLVVDKRSYGLSYSLAQYCSSFVHIPHYSGFGDCMNDNVNDNNPSLAMVTLESCLSIVLYEFTSWARYKERDYQGQKYYVENVQKGSRNGNMAERKRQARQAKKDDMQADGEGWGSGAFIYDDISTSAAGDY